MAAVIDQIVDQDELGGARQRIALHDMRHEIAHKSDAAVVGRAEQHAVTMRHRARAVVLRMQRLVERFGENVVGESDVVVGTPGARDFVDGPAERAMIDDHVAHRLLRAAFDLERIAIVGIRTVGVVSRADTDVLDEHVGGGDLDRGTADHDAG